MGFGIGAIFGCSFGYVLGVIMRTGKQAEMMQAEIAEQNLRSAQLHTRRSGRTERLARCGTAGRGRLYCRYRGGGHGLDHCDPPHRLAHRL